MTFPQKLTERNLCSGPIESILSYRASLRASLKASPVLPVLQGPNDTMTFSQTQMCVFLLCRIHGRTLMLYLLRDLEALSCALFLAAPQGGDYL